MNDNTIENLTKLITFYESAWSEIGQWRPADLTHAAAFLATEAGEALSEALRLEGGYVRNTDRAAALGAELADVLLMLLITAQRGGVDLPAELRAKLQRMDSAKRLEASYRAVGGDHGDQKTCNNPQCHRVTPLNVDYCCRPCRLAHEGGYSVTGLHSPECNQAAGNV